MMVGVLCSENEVKNRFIKLMDFNFILSEMESGKSFAFIVVGSLDDGSIEWSGFFAFFL